MLVVLIDDELPENVCGQFSGTGMCASANGGDGGSRKLSEVLEMCAYVLLLLALRIPELPDQVRDVSLGSLVIELFQDGSGRFDVICTLYLEKCDVGERDAEDLLIGVLFLLPSRLRFQIVDIA